MKPHRRAHTRAPGHVREQATGYMGQEVCVLPTTSVGSEEENRTVSTLVRELERVVFTRSDSLFLALVH